MGTWPFIGAFTQSRLWRASFRKVAGWAALARAIFLARAWTISSGSLFCFLEVGEDLTSKRGRAAVKLPATSLYGSETHTSAKSECAISGCRQSDKPEAGGVDVDGGIAEIRMV